MSKAKSTLIRELEGELEELDSSKITHLLDIARILRKGTKTTARAVQEILLKRGLVTMHPKSIVKSHLPVPIKGKPLSETIIEDRI